MKPRKKDFDNNTEALVLRVLDGSWNYQRLATELCMSRQGAINLVARAARVMFMSGRLILKRTTMKNREIIKELYE